MVNFFRFHREGVGIRGVGSEINYKFEVSSARTYTRLTVVDSTVFSEKSALNRNSALLFGVLVSQYLNLEFRRG